MPPLIQFCAENPTLTSIALILYYLSIPFLLTLIYLEVRAINGRHERAELREQFRNDADSKGVS